MIILLEIGEGREGGGGGVVGSTAEGGLDITTADDDAIGLVGDAASRGGARKEGGGDGGGEGTAFGNAVVGRGGVGGLLAVLELKRGRGVEVEFGEGEVGEEVEFLLKGVDENVFEINVFGKFVIASAKGVQGSVAKEDAIEGKVGGGDGRGGGIEIEAMRSVGLKRIVMRGVRVRGEIVFDGVGGEVKVEEGREGVDGVERFFDGRFDEIEDEGHDDIGELFIEGKEEEFSLRAREIVRIGGIVLIVIALFRGIVPFFEFVIGEGEVGLDEGEGEGGDGVGGEDGGEEEDGGFVVLVVLKVAQPRNDAADEFHAQHGDAVHVIGNADLFQRKGERRFGDGQELTRFVFLGHHQQTPKHLVVRMHICHDRCILI